MQKPLKTVVGIIATAAITKATESLFDVSIFKPIFLTLWGWVQVLWAWLGSDVGMPMWLVVLWCLSALFLVGIISLLVYRHSFEKEEEAPKGQALTTDQMTAFLAISQAVQDGSMLTGDDLRRKTGLSRIATDAALDHLYGIGLIEPEYGVYQQKYVGLTHFGRAYYLELESRDGLEPLRASTRIL
ncbi:hypothetical protein [Pseudomonas promysalinigenes]|uniref:hypothetical protein n=1 Tax=Pseudomonas promysalinigenes TaxID=485898 RepID=UPI003F9FCDAB